MLIVSKAKDATRMSYAWESKTMTPDRYSGRIRPYSNALVELSRAVDVLLIVLSQWLVSRWLGMTWEGQYTILALVASLVFVVSGSFYRLYRSWRVDSLYKETSSIILCWSIATLVTGFVAGFIPSLTEFPHLLAWWWYLVTLVLLASSRVATRLMLRFLRVRGHNFRRVAIVGSTHIAAQLADAIYRAPWMGLKVIGFYDDRRPDDKRVVDILGHPLSGNVDDLIKCVKDDDIDTVCITLPLRAEMRIKEMIDRLSETPASVLYVPDFFVFNMLHAQWENIGHLNIVNVVTTPFLGVSGVAKRLEDIVLSSLILLLIAIPMGIIALAIKSTSAGPVIFRQRRYGLNGKEFVIWKFRTMTVREDGAAFVQAVREDSRVTPLGRFLRSTSMDELPQFINVLQGTMSVVGPRPHPVALDEQHRRLIPRYMLRHKIRPGITGLAQINGFRGPTDTPDKMQKRIAYDIEYIDQWSLLLDLKIILLTVLRGFTDKNAC